MENEVKCVRTLPDDYTPVYLIDRRSPGPMAVILFVAAFFIDILLVALPIVLGGVEFTLAVPGLIGMACTGSGPFFWMFLLFQLPSLLACYHPVNDAMALHNLPDNVLIYREGWQMKFYAPEGTKTNIKVYKPKPKKKR